MNRSIEISPIQARKLALLSQGIHRENDLGLSPTSALSATLKAIEKLGYVQIDTISVVERAHHHTLWSRTNHYAPEQLHELQLSGEVYEYWSHAAAYLPMRDFRFSLPRKQFFKDQDKHWHKKDPKLAQHVLQRITSDGPLQAKDFEHKRNTDNSGWWDWKPAKRALEQLFMEGELMVAERRGFQKVYDLTERVLPSGIDTSVPNKQEHSQHLIRNYLRANGIGTPAQISYLLKGIKANITQQCNNMLENGELIMVQVKQQCYYALPNIEKLLATPLSRNKVKILSPFDNVLIQRKRTLELFDFDYQIECYVPAAKRQYGYFCLPLLWGHNFAGRMDAKIDRRTSILHILNLHLETDRPNEFKRALEPALEKFLAFNHGREIVFN